MTTIMRNMLFGFTVLSGVTFASAPSWTDPGNWGIYWFEADGTELERGSDIRSDDAPSGTSTSTYEEFERVTKTWVPAESYYLKTSDGTWQTEGGTHDYTISTTSQTNDTLNSTDGSFKLTDTISIASETTKLSPCFDVDVTFSAGAMRYDGQWKDNEMYELWWTPADWQTQATYATLNDFMNSDQPFLWNRHSQDNAGFRENANLSDGSGDLVIITYDHNDGSIIEGRPVGTWDSTYTLPGQATTSIKLNITDPEFLDDDADFQFAAVHNGVVWIGAHLPTGAWEPVGSDEFIGNEIAYNDYMNAMAPYDFSKLVNCDLVDKEVLYDVGGYHSTRYYGNMNYVSFLSTGPGTWQPVGGGTWSVENGTIIEDQVFDDINKTVTAIDLDLPQLLTTHTITGRGELVEIPGQVFGNPLHELSETDIPYRISVDDLKGKKINLTYSESGEPDTTGDVYFFPNMSYSFELSGDNVGVWKVENGVLMLDSYWIADDGVTVETGIESWVFSDPVHATVYNEDSPSASILIDDTSIVDIPAANYSPFTADPLTNPFTVDMLAGKLVVVGDPVNVMDQDKLYFYANMTYKQETHDDDGNPETVTGAWSVEEGAAIIDVVYSDTESVHYVITDNGDDTVRFMEVLGGGTETDPAVQKISISDIPSKEGNSGVLPAVIMYLLN